MKHMAMGYPREWLLLPCVSGEKRPALEYRCAANDHDTLTRWFGRYGRFRTANVAVLCGRVSNLLVLDVENERGAALLKKLGCPLAPRAATGSASCGFHVYLQYPGGDLPLKGCHRFYDGTTGELLMEIRGNMHLALLPPSVTIHRGDDGLEVRKLRTWARDGGGDMSPANLPLPEAPQWVLEAMRKPPEPERKPIISHAHDDSYVQAAMHKPVTGIIPRLLAAANGNRNYTLFCCSCDALELVRDRGADPAEVRAELIGAAQRIFLPSEWAGMKSTICSAHNKILGARSRC